MRTTPRTTPANPAGQAPEQPGTIAENAEPTDAAANGNVDTTAIAPEHPVGVTDADADTDMVTRCVCFDCSFKLLLDRHRADGDGLMEFYQRFGCGSRCSICIPYMLLMLKKQQHVLPVCWSKDFLSEGINPGKVGQIEERLRKSAAATDQNTATDGAAHGDS